LYRKACPENLYHNSRKANLGRIGKELNQNCPEALLIRAGDSYSP